MGKNSNKSSSSENPKSGELREDKAVEQSMEPETEQIESVDDVNDVAGEPTTEDTTDNTEALSLTDTAVAENNDTAEVAVSSEPDPVKGSVVETSHHIGLQVNDPIQTQLSMIQHVLEQYCADMAAGVPRTAHDGSAHQKTLYRTIVQILKLPDSAFYKGWSMLLKIVHEHRQGAFHEYRIYRFFDHLRPLETREVNAFRDLLHLLVTTADPRGRQLALKNLSLESMVKRLHLPIPNLAERLIGYYHH